MVLIHLQLLKLLSSEGSVEESLIKVSGLLRQYQVPVLEEDLYTFAFNCITTTTNIQIVSLPQSSTSYEASGLLSSNSSHSFSKSTLSMDDDKMTWLNLSE